MTIQDRAAIFNNLAKLVKFKESATLYAETAQVLRAMEAGYNDLFSAALLALRDGEDSDLSALRSHVDKCEKAAAKMAAGVKLEICTICNGQGWYVDGPYEQPRQQQCENCRGTGRVDAAKPENQ